MTVTRLLAIAWLAACERAPASDGLHLVATMDDIRVDGAVAVTLDRGRVAAADRERFAPPDQAERDVIRKVLDAFGHRCAPGKVAELQFDGELPAETFFILTSSVSAAGCSDQTFIVRGEPWQIPHHMFRGEVPNRTVELVPGMSDAQISQRAADIAKSPSESGLLIVVHDSLAVRQVMLFAQATPPGLRRVYAFSRDH